MDGKKEIFNLIENLITPTRLYEIFEQKSSLDGFTVFHLAAENAQVCIFAAMATIMPWEDFCKLLEIKNSTGGDTPVHFASFQGHLNIVQCMLY